MFGTLAMMGVNAGMQAAMKKKAAPDATTQTTSASSPSALQTFGSSFMGGAGGSLGSGLGGGIGGGLGGAAGNLIQDRINGSPGEQAKDFMDQAYPGTTVAERISGNAAGSVGGQATSARTAATVAKISADATKYAADKQLEGKRLEHDPEQSIVTATEVEKLHADIRKTIADGSKSISEADDARIRNKYIELYVNKETAVPLTSIPGSKAFSEGANTVGNDLGRWLGGPKQTLRWLRGEIDIKGNPTLKKNAAPTGARTSRAGTMGKQNTPVRNKRTRSGAERRRK